MRFVRLGNAPALLLPTPKEQRKVSIVGTVRVSVVLQELAVAANKSSRSLFV